MDPARSGVQTVTPLTRRLLTHTPRQRLRYWSAAGDFLITFPSPARGIGGATSWMLTPIAQEPPGIRLLRSVPEELTCRGHVRLVRARLRESRRLPPEPDDLGMSLGMTGMDCSGRSPSRLPLSRSPGAARCRKQNPRYAFVRRRLLTHVLALGYALTRARPRRITGCFVPGERRALLVARASARLAPLRRTPPAMNSLPSSL